MTTYDLKRLSLGTTVYLKSPIANCAGSLLEVLTEPADWTPDGKFGHGERVYARVRVYGQSMLFTASQVEAAAAA